MVAERWDLDPMVPGGFQDRLSLPRLNRIVVDMKFNHVEYFLLTLIS